MLLKLAFEYNSTAHSWCYVHIDATATIIQAERTKLKWICFHCIVNINTVIQKDDHSELAIFITIFFVI